MISQSYSYAASTMSKLMPQGSNNVSLTITHVYPISNPIGFIGAETQIYTRWRLPYSQTNPHVNRKIEHVQCKDPSAKDPTKQKTCLGHGQRLSYISARGDASNTLQNKFQFPFPTHTPVTAVSRRDPGRTSTTRVQSADPYRALCSRTTTRLA